MADSRARFLGVRVGGIAVTMARLDQLDPHGGRALVHGTACVESIAAAHLPSPGAARDGVVIRLEREEARRAAA